MKWEGRQGSDNVEDRRGMSGGKIAIGGGIGTIVIALIVWLLGGDPSSIPDTQGTSTGTEQYVPSAEEEQLAKFVGVVLGDLEKVWGNIFEQSGSTYRKPTLVLFTDQVQSACGYASAASVHSTARAMKKSILTSASAMI